MTLYLTPPVNRPAELLPPRSNSIAEGGFDTDSYVFQLSAVRLSPDMNLAERTAAAEDLLAKEKTGYDAMIATTEALLLAKLDQVITTDASSGKLVEAVGSLRQHIRPPKPPEMLRRRLTVAVPSNEDGDLIPVTISLFDSAREGRTVGIGMQVGDEQELNWHDPAYTRDVEEFAKSLATPETPTADDTPVIPFDSLAAEEDLKTARLASDIAFESAESHDARAAVSAAEIIEKYGKHAPVKDSATYAEHRDAVAELNAKRTHATKMRINSVTRVRAVETDIRLRAEAADYSARPKQMPLITRRKQFEDTMTRIGSGLEAVTGTVFVNRPTVEINKLLEKSYREKTSTSAKLGSLMVDGTIIDGLLPHLAHANTTANVKMVPAPTWGSTAKAAGKFLVRAAKDTVVEGVPSRQSLRKAIRNRIAQMDNFKPTEEPTPKPTVRTPKVPMHKQPTLPFDE